MSGHSQCCVVPAPSQSAAAGPEEKQPGAQHGGHQHQVGLSQELRHCHAWTQLRGAGRTGCTLRGTVGRGTLRWNV